MTESFVFRQSGCIEWKVKKLFSVGQLESRTFSFIGTRWRLRLIKSRNDWMDIYLDEMDSKRMRLKNIRIHMFLEDRNGQPQFLIALSGWIPGSCVWGRCVSDLRKKEQMLLKNGVATLVCMFMPEIISDNESKQENSSFRYPFIPPKPAVNLETKCCLENLSVDLHHLLDGSFLSDVKLKCGDRSIPVHKNILSARSEVFLALFRRDMAESRTGNIEISDMEPSTLDQFVQYIYSGKVSELSMDSALQLYAAADKYGIDSLKRLCGNFMKKNLREENVCNVLVLADAHGDKAIKDCALSFIVRTDMLRDEQNWFGFHEKYPKLAAEVIHHVYRAKCSPK